MSLSRSPALGLLLLLALNCYHNSCCQAYSFHASSSRSSLLLKNNNIHHNSASIAALSSNKKKQQQFQRNNQQSFLSMHMGHSHAHHDHHHTQPPQPQPPQQAPPKTIAGHVARFSQRPVARVVFAALVVFVPALFRRLNRGTPLELLFQRKDVAAFVGISTLLSFAEAVRREFKRVLDRAEDWRQGFLKHAPPKTDMARMFAFAEHNIDDTNNNGETDSDTTTTNKQKKKKKKNTQASREQAADRVTLLGVLTNVVLSVGKLAVGITCHSSALVADAGHSLSDLFSDFITLWAVQIARLPPDDDHPYGHGKFEAVGALFLALTLLGTGLSVGGVSYGKLAEILRAQSKAGGAASLLGAVKIPTFPALIMAFLSIVSKEWLYRITRRVGEDLNSQVVLANAWHHRSDAYSSILALVSIALAMLVPGLLAADSAAGLLVGGMICMTGAEIMGEAVKQLTDASADDGLVEKVKQLALKESDDVLTVQRIRTRQMGSKVIVDVAITTPESLSTSATKQVEQRVRYRILKKNPNIVDAEVRANGEPLLDVSNNSMEESSSARQQQANGIEMDPQDHDHSHSHAHTEGDSEIIMEATSFETSSATSYDSVNGATAAEAPSMNSADGAVEGELSDFDAEEDDAQIDMPEPVMVVSSFQEVEDDARRLLNDHSSVRSVEGCTVHYDETTQQVHVDATIKLENPEWTTVTSASALAIELKVVLQEGSDNIHKAKIFLDLNNDASSETELVDAASRAKMNNSNDFLSKQKEITKG